MRRFAPFIALAGPRRNGPMLLSVVLWALCVVACGRDRLPEVLPAKASAERAVVVLVDGLTPALLEAYLGSASSRLPDRALATWLVPGPPDGGRRQYATGQVHAALLPLPALPEPSAAALLTGRNPGALGARDPGDGLPADAVHLGTLVPRAVVVGLLGTPGLESNDADRVTLAREASAKFGADGARLMVVRLSGLFDAVTTRGLSHGPTALARVDAELARLLAPPFDPETTLLVVTSGAAAGPAATQAPLNPGDVARALGLAPEAVVPTGGLLRVRGLPPEKARVLAELAPAREVVRRTATGLEIWDSDLGRSRGLLPDELATDDARRRLTEWLADGEWAAIADRAGGHEFRRVGEDPARVGMGGLAASESLVPVVFAGAVPPGPSRSIALTDVAPAILTLLGRDAPLPGASAATEEGLATLVAVTRRPRSENRVDRGHVVLERGVGTGIEAGLRAQTLPVRRRSLGEGPPLADAALAATLAEARAVVAAEPPRVMVDTALFGSWGGPSVVTLPLDGLNDDAAVARIGTAVRLADGLRALQGGLHPRAATLLARVDDLPTDVEPWRAAFRYWADRAAALALAGGKGMPTAPALGASADGAWLGGLLAVFEALTPGPDEGATTGAARLGRLPASAGWTGTRATLATHLRTLFSTPDDTACVPADVGARRAALMAAADGFGGVGEAGLAARALLQVLRESRPGPKGLSGPETVRLHERLVATLSSPAAGHTRLSTARGALGLRLFAATLDPEPGPPALEGALLSLTRLALLQLQQEIVDDREAGAADRNAARAASLLDGTGAREPALFEATVQLAIDDDADVQSRLVAAVLGSGLNLGALFGGQAAEHLGRLQRMLDVAARPLPGAAGATPEARLVSAIADALAFAVGTLTGRPAPPPFAARDQLAALDLTVLRTQALAAREAAGGDDTPLPLLAYGPFVHLAVELELAFAAAATGPEGPQAAVPHLQAAVDVAARLARAEAGRAGVEADLGPRIDALATALKAAVPLIVDPSDTTGLQAALLAIDLTPPGPGQGLAGQLVAATALLARDAGYALDLARRGSAADARLVAGGTALTRALVDAAVAAGTSRVARDAALLLHGAHAALADAPRYWPDLSPSTILARSPAARAALADVARGLRGGQDDAALQAALRRDDLGVFVRDLLAFAALNVDALAGLAGPGGPARAAALRARLSAHLEGRLAGLSGGAPGEGRRVRSLLLWGLATLAAADGRAERADAWADAAAKHLLETGEAHNAWLYALEAHFARVEAGRPDRSALERAAATCPGQAWQLAPARAWWPADTPAGTALDALSAYVSEARARSTGGLELAVHLRAAEGHDVYEFRLGQSLPAMLLGKRSGTFNLGLGAQAYAHDEVSLDWGANPVGNPRDAALRAWLLAAWNALEADDDVALDAALGRLVTTLDAADPAVFGSEGAEGLPALLPGRPSTLEPLMMAWVLTMAGARGHFALTDDLWSRWVAAVQAGGPDEGTSGTDFGTVALCEAAGGASPYACTAPRHAELRLRDAAAVRSLARWVATEVEARLSRASGQTPPAGAGTGAFKAARKAAPRLLPAWTETLADARAGARGAPKAAPLPRLAEATFIATHHKMAPREAFVRIHEAGGVCEAALRAVITELPAADPEAVASRCGAGPLYVIALIGQPSGSPGELVARAGRAVGALRWLGPSQGEAWARGVVDRVEQIVFHPEPEMRAAARAHAPVLIEAARAARLPVLAVTLRTFTLASALVEGRAPAESAAAILSDARAAGVSGTPATVLLKRLVFDGGAEAERQRLAAAFLVAPSGAASDPGAAPPAGSP